MKWIQNRKRTLRAFSTLALGAVVAIQGVWATLPDEWKTGIPPEWIVGITGVVAVLGFVGRFIDQGIASAEID